MMYPTPPDRRDVQARRIILAVFTPVTYLLLWKWDFANLPFIGVLGLLLIPGLFYILTLGQTPVETAFVAIVLLILLAVGLPVLNKLRKRGIVEYPNTASRSVLGVTSPAPRMNNRIIGVPCAASTQPRGFFSYCHLSSPRPALLLLPSLSHDRRTLPLG